MTPKPHDLPGLRIQNGLYQQRCVFNNPVAYTTGLLLFLCLQTSYASDSDWFLEETRQIHLDLRYGQFDNNQRLLSVSLNAPLPGYAECSAQHTLISGDDQKETSSGLYIQTDPLTRFSIGIGYEKGELPDLYRASDWVLLAGTQFSHWYLETTFLRGKTDLTPLALSTDDPTEIPQYETLSNSRTGLGIAATYYASQWALQLALRDYQTEHNSRLNTFNQDANQEQRQDSIELERSNIRQLFRERQRSAIQSPSYANRQYFRQISHIADREASADINFSLNKFSITSGLAWFDNHYYNEQVTSVYGSAEYPISDTVDLGLLLSTSDDDTAFYSELSLGLSW